MKALSVKPPWAQFIIYGIPLFDEIENADGSKSVKLSDKVVIKNIENRNRPLPKEFKIPQRIYIHASKRDDSFEAVLDMCLKRIGLSVMSVLPMTSPKLGRGMILGEVDIVDCVTESKNPWFVGPYGFILANPEPYEKPIPCKGKLGFFEPDIERMVPRG